MMQRKSIERSESKLRDKPSRGGSASRGCARETSRWVSAYENALAELTQLLADAAELRALYNPTQSQR